MLVGPMIGGTNDPWDVHYHDAHPFQKGSLQWFGKEIRHHAGGRTVYHARPSAGEGKKFMPASSTSVDRFALSLCRVDVPFTIPRPGTWLHLCGHPCQGE